MTVKLAEELGLMTPERIRLRMQNPQLQESDARLLVQKLNANGYGVTPEQYQAILFAMRGLL